MANEITIPDFEFTSFFYPEIKRALRQFTRIHVPEITEESEEEPFTQLLNSFALVGHLNNVLLDLQGNESYLATSQLLESVRLQLQLIDFRLKQNLPASTDVVLEFSKTFIVPTNIVPANSQFATRETEESPQIIFENNESITIQPTNAPTALFSFQSGLIKILNNTFDGGDSVTVESVEFRAGIEFTVGGTIADTLTNLQSAINTSSNTNINQRLHALSNGVDELQIIPLVPEVESISITETDGATNNFTVASGGFGANRASQASTDSVTFNLFQSTPKAGDVLYIGHQDVMWNTLNFTFDTPGAGLTFAIEFFDGNQDDANPDDVTNLGSNLRFDLTKLLGSNDRTGSVVRVVYTPTGADEIIVSEFVGGVNRAETSGLLGQSVVDTDPDNYIVGRLWDEVDGVSDNTSALTQDGGIQYTLPQTITQNWIKTTVNSFNAQWLRLRVISVSTPTNPVADRVRIDTGSQFLTVPVVQGQTVSETPIGSSNGGADQEFDLGFRPLIEGTLEVEIDEGSGFQAWNSVENFLNSSQSSKDYVLTIRGDDTAFIRFGDGISGKIPTPGVDNIQGVYRIGADINGNVGARTIQINKSGISFVNRVFNPRQATGWSLKEGSTPEDLARVKIVGPASLRTRNRAVSTADVEFLANEFLDSNGSNIVSRSLAIEETFGVKTIELVVVGPSGALLTEAQRTELTDFFNGNKLKNIDGVLVANHEVTVVNYTPRVINVTATVTGGNAEQISNAITALLNADSTFDDGVTKRWDFGQEIPVSVIVAEIFEVDPINIKKVVISTPASDVTLNTRELPLAGNISVTII